MSQAEPQPLSEPRRKEIFAALVETQDQGITVAQSRKTVAARFGVTVQQVMQVEREGMDNDWPPL
jgi:chromosomal replication initiation ATPase DnaA